jgi:uncharacterized membrane protein YraQ (UPF0718 family)
VPSEHRASRRLSLADTFGTSFWVLGLIAVLAGIACWQIKGPKAFRESFESDLDLLLFLAPRFGAAMLIAAFVQVLLPRDKVAKYVGDAAGPKAVAIGTVAGGLTPGGPMTSFPLVQSLQQAGTGRSALVAYITSWSTMGFQRILNWELPLLGPDMTLLRVAASLPLPAIAGLLSRLFPEPPLPRRETDGTADAR